MDPWKIIGWVVVALLVLGVGLSLVAVFAAMGWVGDNSSDEPSGRDADPHSAELGVGRDGHR